MTAICPECGAAWGDGETCETYFHQMLFWESEFPEYGMVHHLMVLCYHLQHPSMYSPEGLLNAKSLLVSFVRDSLTPQEARQRNRAEVDSGQRKWTVTARAGSQGAYANPVAWTMTTADVIANGANRYINSITAWAESVYESLQTSHNL